jgi:uncharacterized membrane protein YgaE (UPF0421/DUF939 family)
MLEAISRFLRGRRRASISQELTHLYDDMRQVKENTRLAKLFADQQEAKSIKALEDREKKLIDEAKHIDAQDLHRSIPTRNARAW